MPTKLEIWNQSLSAIGAQGSVADEDEVSKEAAACRLHYDNVRTTLLRAAHWGCARFQLALDEAGNAVDGTSIYPWLYIFEYPTDCIKLRYLIAPAPTNEDSVPTGDPLGNYFQPSRSNRFLVGLNSVTSGMTTTTSKVIMTNVKDAVGIYTLNLEDPALFDDGFADALIAGLSAKLCLPLTGNVQMKTTFEQLAMRAVNDARVSDGNEAMPSVDSTPDWLATRGDGNAFPWNGPGVWYQSWDNIGWAE